MYTLLKPLNVRGELIKRSLRIFTPQLFARIFQTNADATKYFLEKQTEEGFLLRLKKGLYTLKTDPPGEEEIANALYQPSYISFEYALGFYGILPEMTYTITSATTKPTRLFTANQISFSYRTIKPLAYTGYTLRKTDNKSYLLAEPEKAWVDYNYFALLNRPIKNDRLIIRLKDKGYYNLGSIDIKKAKGYAHLFGNQLLIKTIEGLL